MRVFIEGHFGLILIFSCLLGLALPIEGMPDSAASVALAMLTYASCFKLKDGGFSEIRWGAVMRFYVARYIALPVALLMTAHFLLPNYALGIFLLALTPAAVSSPAFCAMFGGAVPPAFAIAIVSQMLAPLVIPLQFSLASDVTMNISPLGMFKTLAFCVFVPMALYFMTRRLKRWGEAMYVNMKAISIMLVAFVIALVIAKQRDAILSDVPGLLIPALACLSCYACFIATGWWLGRTETREVKITYITCSSFNNVALGVSLALLHFPSNVILFVAVSEAAWSLLPIILKRLTAFSTAGASPPRAS